MISFSDCCKIRLIWSWHKLPVNQKNHAILLQGELLLKQGIQHYPELVNIGNTIIHLAVILLRKIYCIQVTEMRCWIGQYCIIAVPMIAQHYDGGLTVCICLYFSNQFPDPFI